MKDDTDAVRPVCLDLVPDGEQDASSVVSGLKPSKKLKRKVRIPYNHQSDLPSS